MSTQAILRAELRTVTGKASRHLRQHGTLPANLTGAHMEPSAIQVNAIEFEKLLKANRRTAVINLTIAPNAETQPVMIGKVQREPVTGAIQHIDFLAIAMNTRMHARITLRLTGESPAVRLGLGVLLQALNEIEVEALPNELPEAIEVSITGLAAVEDALYVRDVSVASSVVIQTGADELVARIVHTRASIEASAEASSPAAPTPAEEAQS